MKRIKKAVLVSLLILLGQSGQQAFAFPDYFDMVVIPSTIEFQVIDPAGNITGYDPVTKNVINNIPYTRYRLKHVIKNDSAVSYTKEEIYHEVEPSGPTNIQMPIGKYKLKLFGANSLEKVGFGIRVDYTEIMHAVSCDKDILMFPNVVWVYEYEIPIAPPANYQIIFTKASSPSELITDITTASQLGYIGNTKFVNELIKEVQEIEKERTAVRKPEEAQSDKEKEHLTPAQKAIKEYKELLKEITEKYQKPEGDEFVKKEAYDVLKEDLDYIIGHIQ